MLLFHAVVPELSLIRGRRRFSTLSAPLRQSARAIGKVLELFWSVQRILDSGGPADAAL